MCVFCYTGQPHCRHSVHLSHVLQTEAANRQNPTEIKVSLDTMLCRSGVGLIVSRQDAGCMTHLCEKVGKK